ncbi:MAG: ABC transporter permease [Acidimicrobiia bacterium]|nr:ABC transporter permease [Acidimicrobiia bacterium]
MVLRVDYLAKETGNNLVRNPTLTVATVLTVAVSLALLGASLLIQRGVEGFNTRFKDDVEFIVWMNADAEPENIERTAQFLQESLTVKDFTYVNKEATFIEFQEYYADQPEVLDLVEADQLPTSFRVVPEIADLALIRALGDEIEALPGINGVDYAEEYIKQLNDITGSASQVMITAAVLSAVASSLLMYNTIRTGLFARRREIEVMRLVGATKWFIRIPFMMEGLLQGLIGAVFSALAIFGLNKVISRSVLGENNLRLFESFALDTGEVASVAVILLLVGAALGALGAGIAVTRYLDA